MNADTDVFFSHLVLLSPEPTASTLLPIASNLFPPTCSSLPTSASMSILFLTHLAIAIFQFSIGGQDDEGELLGFRQGEDGAWEGRSVLSTLINRVKGGSWEILLQGRFQLLFGLLSGVCDELAEVVGGHDVGVDASCTSGFRLMDYLCRMDHGLVIYYWT